MKEYIVSKLPLRNMQEATDLINRHAEDGFSLLHAVQVPPDVIVFLEKNMTPVQAEPSMAEIKREARAKAVKKTVPVEEEE